MARRLIYNPVDYIQASTPFYDNIIGTITDQTDRIQRNLDKAEQAAMIAEERQFEQGMQEQRLKAEADLRTDLQEDQQEFYSERDRAERVQRWGEHEDIMDWRWAQLRMKKLEDLQENRKAAQEQFSQQAEDLRKRVHSMYEKLTKGGWKATDQGSVENISIGWNGESFTVQDLYAGTETPVGKWMRKTEPLLGIQDALAGGDNIFKWIDSNTYDAKEDFGGLSMSVGEGEVVEDTVVDGEGNIGLGRDALRTAAIQVRDGLDDGSALELLTKVADKDSKYFVLEKEDELTTFDRENVSATVGSVRKSLLNLGNYWGNLVGLDSKQFNYEGEDLGALLPNITPIEGSQIGKNPEVVYEAKTIGGLRRAQYRMKHEFGDAETGSGARLLDDTQYKGIVTAIDNLENMAVQTITEYKDQIVPDELKDKPITFLANIARVDQNEVMKDNPDPRNLFRFPAPGSDEIRDLQDKTVNDLQSYYSKTNMKQKAVEKMIDQGRTFYTIPGMDKRNN